MRGLGIEVRGRGSTTRFDIEVRGTREQGEEKRQSRGAFGLSACSVHPDPLPGPPGARGTPEGGEPFPHTPTATPRRRAAAVPCDSRGEMPHTQEKGCRQAPEGFPRSTPARRSRPRGPARRSLKGLRRLPGAGAGECRRSLHGWRERRTRRGLT